MTSTEALRDRPPRRARRLRAAWVPLAIAYVVRLVVGGAMVAPALGSVDRLLRHVPGGDRDLSANGAALLVETLWHLAPTTSGFARHAGIVGLVAALFGLLPLAWTLHALVSDSGAPARSWLASGMRSFPTFAAILGAGAVAETLLFAMALFAWGAIDPSFDTPRQALVATSVTALLLVPAAVATIARDIAFSSSALRGARFYDSCARAVVVLRRRPFAVLSARLIAAAVSGLFLAAGLCAPIVIGMSSVPRFLLVGFVEQLSIGAMVVVRAGYLARLTDIDAGLGMRTRRRVANALPGAI